MSYELIETVEVGSGGAASIEFTSIPQDGTDLVLKVSARASTSSDNHKVRFNNSTTGIYDEVNLKGSGSSASSTSRTNSTDIFLKMTDTDFTANTFGSYSMYISNYASTTSHKSISIDLVTENNATSAEQELYAYLSKDNAAITSIKQTEALAEGSVFSLYKITAA